MYTSGNAVDFVFFSNKGMSRYARHTSGDQHPILHLYAILSCHDLFIFRTNNMNPCHKRFICTSMW